MSPTDPSRVSFDQLKNGHVCSRHISCRLMTYCSDFICTIVNNIQIYKIIVVRNNSEKEDKCPVRGAVNWGNTKMFPDQKDLLVTPAVKQTPVFVAEKRVNITLVTRKFCLKKVNVWDLIPGVSFHITKQIYKCLLLFDLIFLKCRTYYFDIYIYIKM